MIITMSPTPIEEHYNHNWKMKYEIGKSAIFCDCGEVFNIVTTVAEYKKWQRKDRAKRKRR